MDNKPGLLRTTFVSGVLYMIPIVLLLAILGKAMQLAQQISPPFQRAIEAAHLENILKPQIVAILVLLLFCLAAGVFARTVLAKRITASLDSKLENIPGYSLYKGVGESLVGGEPEGFRSIVMVSIEDAWQLGTIVDELEDGLLAVFIPSVPQAGSGSLYFMAPDRVRRLSISTKSALLTLRRMGVGSRALLKGEMLSGDPSGAEVQRQSA